MTDLSERDVLTGVNPAEHRSRFTAFIVESLGHAPVLRNRIRGVAPGVESGDIDHASLPPSIGNPALRHIVEVVG